MSLNSLCKQRVLLVLLYIRNCHPLSSPPTAAVLSVCWTMKYFKTQGRGRQPAARLCCCAHWALILPFAVGLLTRVWYVCIPPPAHHLLISASPCCLGRCAWQSLSPFSWVGWATQSTSHPKCFRNYWMSKPLSDTGVRAMVGHGYFVWWWEVRACVAVTGGLHRAVWFGFFFAMNLFCKIHPHW